MDPVVKPRGDIKDYWIPAFAGMTYYSPQIKTLHSFPYLRRY
nr:hypothetical protein [Rickettsia rhipicephali]